MITMHIVHTTCRACGEYAPAAMLATLGDGRELALCRACMHVREHRHAFIATFRDACHPTCLTPLANAQPRTLAVASALVSAA